MIDREPIDSGGIPEWMGFFCVIFEEEEDGTRSRNRLYVLSGSRAV